MRFPITAYLLCLIVEIIFVNADDAERKFVRVDIAENDEVPRVKIKVFRGPNNEREGKQFATWGFWIKEPTKLDLAN